MDTAIKQILETPVPSSLKDKKILDALRHDFSVFETYDFKNVYDTATLTEFKSIDDLKKYLIELGVPELPNKYLGILIEHWYETLSLPPEYQGTQTEESEYTEATVTEQPAATTVGEIKLEELVEAQDKKNAQAVLEKDKPNVVQEAIDRKKEIFEEQEKLKQLEEVEKLTRSVKNKKVVVVPTEKIPVIELSEKEKEVIFAFSQMAKEDPESTKQFIENKITESLAQSPVIYQQNITAPIIEKTAISITENFKQYPLYTTAKDIPNKIPVMHPASPVVAITILNNARLKNLISDQELQQKTVEMAQTVALALEAENTVNYAGANAIFGPEIAATMYGPADGHITQFEIAENQEEQKNEGIELDLEQIYDYGKDITDVWQKVRAGQTTVDEVATTTLTYTPTYSAPSATVSAQTTTTLTKAIPTTFGAIYGFRQGALAAQWARMGSKMLPGGSQSIVGLISSGIASGQTTATVSSSAFIMSKPIGFTLGNFSVGFVTGTQSVSGAQIAIGGFRLGSDGSMLVGLKEGTKIGLTQISSQAGIKGATTALTKGGSQVAIKALPAASGLLSKVFGFLGVAATPVGAAVMAGVGWLVGKVIEKIDWGKVKRFFSENGPIMAVLLVGGGMFLRNPFMLAGGIGLGAATIAYGGTRAIAAGVGGFLFTLKFLLRNIIGPSIIAPIAITMLVLPVLVAFIMFVINSGAYLVPPTPATLARIGQVVSPYIDVKKEIINIKDKTGTEFSYNSQEGVPNESLPITVTYRVTIAAKKSPLSNITITDSCSVRKESSSATCPPPNPNIPPTITDTISPTTPYTFEFQMVFNNLTYTDSRTTNTITITADTPEQSGTTSAGSASLRIGDPPDDCPYGWPVRGKYRITQTPGGSYSHNNFLQALDIAVGLGTPIYATHTGVATVFRNSGVYGPNYVDITSNCDGIDFATRYAHLSAVSLTTGQTVNMGDIVGNSGTAGSGAHLHYEFRNGLMMVNPYIPADAYPNYCSKDYPDQCGFTE